MALMLKILQSSSRLNVHLVRPSSALQCYLRNYSEKSSSNKVATSKDRSEIGEAKPLGEKVKETVKTTSYMGVIVIGVAVTAIMFYAIFSELFSSNSPQAVYTEALQRCIDDTRVQDALGMPIKGYGEESRRRRRTHIAHQLYQKDGRIHMRVTFHIQGIRNKATVQCDMRQNDKGKYEYRYLLVQLDSYPHTTIIIEDNRLSDPLPIESNADSDSKSLPLKGIFS